MRRLTLLAALVLAFAALLAAGCVSSGSSSAGLARMTGVVEIYRVTPSERELVGYLSNDPVDPDTSIWFLDGSEVAPVMPDASVPGETVEFVTISLSPMSGPELCTNYGSTLSGPQLWYLHRDPPTPCGAEPR